MASILWDPYYTYLVILHKQANEDSTEALQNDGFVAILEGV